MAESVLKARRRGSQVWLSCLAVVDPSPWGGSSRCPFAQNDSGGYHCCNSLPESAGWAESLMSYMKSCVCPSILLLPLPCFWNSGWSLTSTLRCYGFFHSLLIGIPFPSLLTSSLPSNPPLICLYCLIPTEHCNSFSLEWALTLCIVDVPQSPAHWRWNELMVS